MGPLTRGTLPPAESGAYKTRPNAVFDGPRVLYRPPPPEAAPLLTRALVGWLNSSNAMAEHAVVVSAVAHHRLVSIHPFSDGNGRASRALGGWLLYRRGFDLLHLFALDEFFEADRARYYREIQKVRERRDDLSSWLEYAAEGVAETLRQTKRRIQAIRAPGRSSRLTLTRAQERILQVLGESPALGGGDLARSLRLSRSHLSKLLKPLLNAGLVVKEGSTKAARYRPA